MNKYLYFYKIEIINGKVVSHHNKVSILEIIANKTNNFKGIEYRVESDNELNYYIYDDIDDFDNDESWVFEHLLDDWVTLENGFMKLCSKFQSTYEVNKSLMELLSYRREQSNIIINSYKCELNNINAYIKAFIKGE